MIRRLRDRAMSDYGPAWAAMQERFAQAISATGGTGELRLVIRRDRGRRLRDRAEKALVWLLSLGGGGDPFGEGRPRQRRF